MYNSSTYGGYGKRKKGIKKGRGKNKARKTLVAPGVYLNGIPAAKEKMRQPPKPKPEPLPSRHAPSPAQSSMPSLRRRDGWPL